VTRLSFPDVERAPEGVRRAIDAMPLGLAVVHVLAHAEAAFEPFLRFNGAVLYNSSLDRRLCELAVCAVTSIESPQYEHAYHRQALLATGFTDEQLAALERGDLTSPSLDERDRAVIRFAREIRERVRASDDTLAALREHLTERQVVEVILCVGQYMLNSRISENAGLTVADDAQFAKPGQQLPPVPR
jgi:alkylhydroperoxidase family enzyme